MLSKRDVDISCVQINELNLCGYVRLFDIQLILFLLCIK